MSLQRRGAGQRPRRRLHATFAVVAVLVLLLQAVPDDRVRPASAADNQGRGGIAMGGAWTWLPPEVQAADLDKIAAAGAAWIRVSFRWSAMQPQADRYNWSVHDRIVRLAYERDLKVIANVAYTPPWARSPDCDHPHCPPASPASYARFVEAAVTRYAAYNVRAWEIWNEPNLGNFWRPAPDPQAYTALLRRAYAAAKRADPTVTVISGGLGPRGLDSEGNLTPTTFLSRMYAAGGGPYLDAVGIHPYSFPRAPLDPSPTNTFSQLPDLHALMGAAGDADKQLWITEYGYWTSPLGDTHWLGSVTEAEQARYLTEAYDAAAQPWLGPLLWFTFRDTGEGEDADFQRDRNFGLIREDGQPKPAFEAFSSAQGASDPECAQACVTTAISVRRTKTAEQLRTRTLLQGAPEGSLVRVSVHRLKATGWHRVRLRKGAVDADGLYRTAFSRPAPGTCLVKAVFSGTATHQRSIARDRLRC